MSEEKLVDKIKRIKDSLEGKLKEFENSELKKSIIDKKILIPKGLENFAYDVIHKGKTIYEKEIKSKWSSINKLEKKFYNTLWFKTLTPTRYTKRKKWAEEKLSLLLNESFLGGIKNIALKLRTYETENVHDDRTFYDLNQQELRCYFLDLSKNLIPKNKYKKDLEERTVFINDYILRLFESYKWFNLYLERMHHTLSIVGKNA